MERIGVTELVVIAVFLGVIWLVGFVIGKGVGFKAGLREGERLFRQPQPKDRPLQEPR